MKIDELWHCSDPAVWRAALDRYIEFTKPSIRELVRDLEPLDLNRLRALDPQGWYEFLHDKYFRWKYTAPNRLATTRAKLRTYVGDGALEELDAVRWQLLSLDPDDTEAALNVACEIRGLGIAGASGLLALMYPRHFGTVDQFMVKALLGVSGLPEKPLLERAKPEGLRLQDGVLLIQIMRNKAASNNAAFGGDFWTPKRIDEILWTYGRPEPC